MPHVYIEGIFGIIRRERYGVSAFPFAYLLCFSACTIYYLVLTSYYLIPGVLLSVYHINKLLFLIRYLSPLFELRVPRHAPYSILYALDFFLCTLESVCTLYLPHTPCCLLLATYYLLLTTYYLLRAPYSTLYAIDCVLCALHCVLCTVYVGRWTL